MSLLNFIFAMIYTIHKMLELLENQLRSIIDFYFYSQKNNLLHDI